MVRFLAPARFLSALSLLAASLLVGATGSLLGACGPFTDTANDAFCPFILEVFYSGITTGTTPATYDPTAAVSRTQMAAFLSRGVDGTLKRANRRSVVGQFWNPQSFEYTGVTTISTITNAGPNLIRTDGQDLWSANTNVGTVSRVQASSGKLLETWTGATQAHSPLIAMWKVIVTGATSPGSLYAIDPSQPAGAVTTVASNLGNTSHGIAFDGSRVWTANLSGSVSIVAPGATVPWSATTVTAGFTGPEGMVFDGTNVWVTDVNPGTILKLASTGDILQTITVGITPEFPVFDGINIWVPVYGSSAVAVIRASTGAVLATLTGNGLIGPVVAAFDGQRVLTTNFNGRSVSLWKAADLSPLGNFNVAPMGSGVAGVCSDGIAFYITHSISNRIVRF